MNSAAMINAMRISIFEVLEKMFFLPVDIAEDDGQAIPSGGDAAMAASLSFEGKMSGCFLLWMPEKLAGSISADFLGIRPRAVTDAHISGTIKEMINILAGNTLRAFDAQALFDLNIPSLVEVDRLERDLEAYGNHVAVGIETLESRMTFFCAEKDDGSLGKECR